MRAQKALKNTIWGLLNEIVVLACGLVLPRLVLTSFGSEYNGMTSAIAQFLNVISLFQAGIGWVTMSALFKPLAEKDIAKISIIMKTTESYLRKVAFAFLGVSLLVACVYPFFVRVEFDFLFAASLVLIMSLSTFAQYFFGLTYQLLLNADQRQWLTYAVNMVSITANTVISVMLIRAGYGIHAVKLGSAVVFAVTPIFMYVYTRRKYKILPHVKKDNSVLAQRWDSFGIQAAGFVVMNTGIIALSVLTNVLEVSVYAIYRMVITGVFGIFSPFVSGVSVAFGSMLVKNEQASLQKNLRLYEQVVCMLGTFLFGVTAAMILPFVSIYTRGVTDIDYHRPVFAYVLIAATIFRAIRLPYTGVSQAAGHFKQNRNLGFVEAGINAVVSVVLVLRIGLAGVAFGALFAYAFRTIRYAMYVSANIIPRSNWIFVKRIGFSLFSTSIIAVMPYILSLAHPQDYLSWAINAAVIASISMIIILSIELLFYRQDLRLLLQMIKRSIKKGRI